MVRIVVLPRWPYDLERNQEAEAVDPMHSIFPGINVLHDVILRSNSATCHSSLKVLHLAMSCHVPLGVNQVA